MSALLPGIGAAYVSVPKIACTSLKSLAFEIENGRPHVPFIANGRPFRVHEIYPSRAFDRLPHDEMADLDAICVVRDPLARIVSCYTNRVLDEGDLDAERIAPEWVERGAEPRPHLHVFIARLAIYRQASRSIFHHTQPQIFFLGTDPGVYARVFRFDELGAVTEELSRRAGRPLTLPRLQRSGTRMTVDDLRPASIPHLKRFYEADYAAYGAWL